MSDFGRDVFSAILANKKKRDEAVAAQQPVKSTTPPTTTLTPNGDLVSQESNSSHTTVIPTPTTSASSGGDESGVAGEKEAVPDTSTQPPKEVKKKDEEQVNGDSKSSPPKEESSSSPASSENDGEVLEEFKWDEGIGITTESTEQSKLDLSKIGSALKLEVKTEEEFVKTVSEKLKELEELKNSASLDGLPENLKQVIEVAKKGGDWMAYTSASAFDASKLDPIELFETEFRRQEAFNYQTETGSIDHAKLDEDLQAIPDSLKRMQGNAIKSQIIARQKHEQAQILAQAAMAQERFQKGLSEAAKDLHKLVPKEQFGITIEPKHASYLYDGVSNGTLVKKHLGNIDPSLLVKLDSKKLMKTLALAEFGEKISQFQLKQGEVRGKKAILKETQNPVIVAPTHLPDPTPAQDQPQPTTADKVRQMREHYKPKGSL